MQFEHAKQLFGSFSYGSDSAPLVSGKGIPRPAGESRMKDLRTLTLVDITLPAGQVPLIPRVHEILGEFIMNVRRITLTLYD